MATKGRQTKAEKAARKAELERKNCVKREVTGVLLIALGLFFAASLYVDAVGIVGRVVSRVCFGLFGVLSYVLPLILVALGVLSIAASSGKGAAFSTFVLSLLALLCILVLLHANARSAVESVNIWDYYVDAYQFGSNLQKGGGVFGALLAYPSLIFLGIAGTNIIFIALLVILLLVGTQISLRSAGIKMGRQIKSGATVVAEKIDVGRKTLFNEILDAPVESSPPKSRPGYTGIKVERRPLYEEETGNPALDKLSYFPSAGELPLRDDADDDPFDILEGVEAYASDDDAPVSRISERKSRAKTVHQLKEEKGEGPADEPAQEADELPKAAPGILDYQRPPYTLLNVPQRTYAAEESPAEKGRMLLDTLQSFNISARVVNITVGPVITRFELQPAQGVRVSRITILSDDIALALAAPRVRIEAPIPGKAAIGIEIPNKNIQSVLLREVIESAEFIAAKSPLAFALGKDIAGKVVTADLDRMPHLLIAGTTGSGKSVCINDIILSMIYHTAPSDLRMILVDPKKVELKVYSPLPHLLLPVVTDAKKAAGALKWAVMEMDQRYQKMSLLNARDLNRYNSLQEDEGNRLPRLVIIIDELADLMMVAAKDVEEAICRIAQLGRAAGIHLIVATQRPSTDIITGLIKANIPSRIALTVSSAVDSRVIMDVNGAEKLLGRGDMLFHASGASKPIRAQAAFVSDEEVERVMDFFAVHNTAPLEQYSEVTLDSIETAGESGPAQGNGKQEDDLLPDAVRIVLDSGQASISMIQRRLRVGYARAARLIDIMEQKKIVSGFDGSKPRRLLITAADYSEMFGSKARIEGGEME